MHETSFSSHYDTHRELIFLQRVPLNSVRSMGSTETSKDKVLLLWVRSLPTPLQLLSLNITREVCVYLTQQLHCVPVIKKNVLRMYDVKQKSVREHKLDRFFNDAPVYCLTERLELIVVGGWAPRRDAYSIIAFKTTKLPSMRVERGWPGIFYWKAQTYIFGGNLPAIRASEKLTAGREWVDLPDMLHSRYAFNPCLLGSKLLLADLVQKHKTVDHFSFLEEQFRVSPYALPLNYHIPSEF